MKKFRYAFSLVLIMVTLLFATGCGSMSVDYDLVTCGDAVTYTTVTKMNDMPSNYRNKTFRIRGELKNRSSSYHYLMGYDSANCCTWNLEVKATEGVSFPAKSKSVIVIGTYKATTQNGQSSWYLEVSEIK